MAKILLIEDDSLLVDVYTTKFQQSGFEVCTVEHGEKAIAAIQNEMPDLILLDIVLPHVDGWDILQQIQESDEFKHIPVVILSNLGQKEEIEKGLRLGAVKYLIKAHYTPSQIVKEVANLL